VFESERLARELFARSARGQQAENLDLLHPDVKIAPSYDTSITVSRAELEAHLMSHEEPAVLEARADSYFPLDNERIIVEGQVLLRTPERGFSYRSAVWALIFRDGVLYRSWCLASVHEAEVVLVSSSRT
jgi:ketosteroid isomerase-like protein